MTDPNMAYIEPITWQTVARIIERERPQALLPTMGGQTALNCALDLCREGVLAKYGVEMIGASIEAIEKAEDREKFHDAMRNINLETPKSMIARSILRHRLWAERAVKVVNQVFPNYKGASNWSECRRCLRCAETCVEHFKQWHFEFEEAAHLLHNLGLFYHWQYGAYNYALETFQLALAIREIRRETEPLQYAVALRNLGLLHNSWKEYDKAQPLLEHALDIRRNWWGETSPKLANLLMPLLKIYDKQGKYGKADNYYPQLSRIYSNHRIGKTKGERVKKL